MDVLFRDRVDAGRKLAETLARERLDDAVVVGLARGGVVVAAEVAQCLGLPLDALAVRKIGHPLQPEYAIGAVTPGDTEAYLRSDEEVGEAELQRAIEHARSEAATLDAVLHEHRSALPLHGKTVVLVDDGLATGATMVAAVRWARRQRAARVVVAVPVAAADGARALRADADDVVCPHEERRFGAVGFWYEVFTQVGDDDVVALLAETPSHRGL